MYILHNYYKNLSHVSLVVDWIRLNQTFIYLYSHLLFKEVCKMIKSLKIAEKEARYEIKKATGAKGTKKLFSLHPEEFEEMEGLEEVRILGHKIDH